MELKLNSVWLDEILVVGITSLCRGRYWMIGLERRKCKAEEIKAKRKLRFELQADKVRRKS